MEAVFLLSLTAAVNPTLVAATTIMLLLPDPKRLMFGYWLGAIMTSITLGLVIVFTLQGSGAVSTTKRTLSPLADIGLGAILLAIALVLRSERDKRLTERRARHSEGKEPPRWQRALSKGTAKTTFVIGAVLTLPGASYLAALTRLSKLHESTTVTVLVVIAVNLIMLILLEAPMIAFAVAPDWTPAALDRAKAWLRNRGRTFAVRGFLVIGIALVVKGIVGLVH
jgi:Sap, sulfolipid-1-addressing protein